MTAAGVPAVYQLPAEPPVGTHLWDANGREWERTSERTFCWVPAGIPVVDRWRERCTWTGVLKHGRLSTVPPTAEEATDEH
jgi:hypothetical protein